jgi:ATP-binding cassette subfamily G (WHITE) protein 2
VVCTIHQPQSKIFRLFQNLVLLKAGQIVYMGPSESALHFFEGLGYKCPEYENPADYFLDGACTARLRMHRAHVLCGNC